MLEMSKIYGGTEKNIKGFIEGASYLNINRNTEEEFLRADTMLQNPDSIMKVER